MCAFAIAAVPACGGSSGGDTSSSGQAEALSLPFGGGDEVSGAAYTQPSSVIEPQLAADSGGEPAVSTDNTADGYVTAQASSPARLKFQVIHGE